MAPVLSSMVNMNFTDDLSSSRRIPSIDKFEKIEKIKMKRQNSTTFPEQQDTKDISSMEEYKRSITLLSTLVHLGQSQFPNVIVPVEHPLSPVAKRGVEVDQWPEQTLSLEKNIATKTISHQKKAVEHEFEAVLYTKENGDYDNQKGTEKKQFVDIKGNEEKQSVTCTEDNEELLIVALPPIPVEGRTSSLLIEEKNNYIILPEVVEREKQTTTRTTQTKEKVAQHSPRPRRHIAGKAKRNQYYVTDPSLSPPPKKRRKVKEKCQVKKAGVLNDKSNGDSLEIVAKPQADTLQKLKARQRKKAQNSKMKQKQKKKEKQQVKTTESKEFVKPAVKNSFVPSYVNKTSGKKYYKAYGVPQSEPTDSGVDSGSSSGSFNGNSNNSKDNKDDVPQGGNGGNGGFGGGGNKSNGRDDDDDNDKKQPWRNGSQITDSSEEEEKMETDKDDCSSDNAISKEPVKAQPALCGKYVPDMQGIDQMVVGTKLQPPKYTVTDVRHAAYCNKGTCQNTNCWKLKAEFEHLKAHNKHDCCERCSSCRSIIELHAKTCPLPSCRVPFCVELKKNSKKNKMKEPSHAPVQLHQNAAYCIPPQFGFHNEQHSKLPVFQSHLHGKVLLQNSAHFPPEGSFFQEHINYHVQRAKPLGNGTNGKVYQVYAETSSHKSQEMAMKVTNYKITEEELKVYKTLGTVHENIVPTYGVTSSGSKDCACIFMQKCDKSLWDVLNIKYPQKLTVEDAMFYVSQVLEAVDYMHRNCVIHRDIKAKNVMLFKKQDFVRAKLGDMDSAKCLEDEFTKSGLAPVGTRGFAAKEVLQRLPHGRPADIYSIGCFILELTVGFPTPEDTLPQKIDKLRELDPVLADIVHQCVAEDVKQRPTAKMLLAHPRFAKYKMARDIPLEV